MILRFIDVVNFPEGNISIEVTLGGVLRIIKSSLSTQSDHNKPSLTLALAVQVSPLEVDSDRTAVRSL